ncbi:hypothetical protein FNF28_03820 [Cafeteria roenbergensis]|uniref:Uncharacterized protein n=1 Tax=Cafeteria roenbergensis TaxID=33653 RepID=A0A5A8DH30_CAFRO|nr:hypothetical protein FNF28_03820 [Cafeteria roenbergensis]
MALRAREEGFTAALGREKMPEYNPLYDANLRHFFGTKSVRSTLFRLGMVDRAGRVIDADQHKGKLHIIEQEFANVEREEEERRKEEAEIGAACA